VTNTKTESFFFLQVPFAEYWCNAGDGRVDFLIVDPDSGKLTARFNGGAEDMPDWQKLGVIATGGSVASRDILRLGDFTCEGRADYMAVGADRKVNGYVNRLQEASGLIPRWLVPLTVASGPDGATRDAVRLVDLTGTGKVDYLLVDEARKVELWKTPVPEGSTRQEKEHSYATVSFGP
jgi:hypothetical protein